MSKDELFDDVCLINYLMCYLKLWYLKMYDLKMWCINMC